MYFAESESSPFSEGQPDDSNITDRATDCALTRFLGPMAMPPPAYVGLVASGMHCGSTHVSIPAILDGAPPQNEWPR